MDLLQLTFPYDDQISASCVTPSGKPKLTRLLKHNSIVTLQAIVSNL